jgi:hypothetical protein
MIAQFAIGLSDGIAKVEAERDPTNNATVNLAPLVMPMDLIKMRSSTFISKVIEPHKAQLQAIACVAPLLWSLSVGVKLNTWKSRKLESSGTPECSELDSKGQNTSHWGVFHVIGKVLKRKYRKWPRIGHLDICSSSYGQKKGRSQTSNLTPDH